MSVDERADDELLSTAGVPRWMTALVAVVALAVLGSVVAVTLSSSSHGHPTAQSSPIPTPSSPAPSPSPGDTPVELPLNVMPVRLPVAGAPSALVADRTSLYAVAAGSLVVRTSRFTARSPLGGIAPEYAYRARLALDSPRHLLWVVVPQDPGALVRVVDATTLIPGITIPWPREILAFAAVGGWLYVVDRTGVFRLSNDGSGGGAQRVAVPGRPYGVAADPTRQRALVLAQVGLDTSLTAVRAAAGASSATRRAPVPGIATSLAVTATGQIWLAGRGALGSFLVRLDPGDLRVIGNSTLGEQFGTAPSVLAAGVDSLLIGDGAAVDRVWCVNDRDGAVTQFWDVAPRAATLGASSGYGVLGSRLVRLVFDGCDG